MHEPLGLLPYFKAISNDFISATNMQQHCLLSPPGDPGSKANHSSIPPFVFWTHIQ